MPGTQKDLLTFCRLDKAQKFPPAGQGPCLETARNPLTSSPSPFLQGQGTTGISAFPLGWPWEAQSSPRVARESWGWRSSHCRA